MLKARRAGLQCAHTMFVSIARRSRQRMDKGTIIVIPAPVAVSGCAVRFALYQEWPSLVGRGLYNANRDFVVSGRRIEI